MGAAFWVGSLSLLAFVTQGALTRSSAPEALTKILPPLIRGYLILSWIAVAALFVTGMEIAHSLIPGWMGTATGNLFLIKLVAFALMGFMAVYVTMGLYPRINFASLEITKLQAEGKSDELLEHLNRFMSHGRKFFFWIKLQLALGLVILFLAVKLVLG